MSKKEREIIMRIRNDFKKSFLLLSNNDTILQKRGLKTSMDSRGQAWKRVWEMTFCGLRRTLASVPLSKNPRNNIKTQVTR